MDHDKLFKELLTTFFADFVDLFLPDVSAYLDRDSLEFLDKEVFTDIALGDKHEVDIIVKARFRNEPAFFILHVENQSSARPGFPKRMFRYFARLYEKYDLPIYPIVIFSYDAPLRPEPKQHRVTFPGFTVNTFNYRVVQLNRLPWRRFVNQSNPIAAALMAKMKIAPQDRPKVKLQCLRLLLTLRLDPAKPELITVFVNSYLKLSAGEQKQYQQAYDALPQPEKEKSMEFVSEWRLEGRVEGRAEGRVEGRIEGKEEMALRMLTHRFGTLSPRLRTRLHDLSSTQFDDLGIALLGFSELQDAEAWLANAAQDTP